MSTTFGIPEREVNIELGDENGIFDYINKDFFDSIAIRGDNGEIRLYRNITFIPDDTRVYALNNSQQGIYTIGDIKKQINKQ